LDEELERIKEQKMKELAKEAGSSTSSGWPSTPVVLTDATFDSFAANHPLTVVDFWATWCGPCRLVEPIVEALAKEYAGKVAFGKLDVDENQNTAMRFNTMSIPTMLVLKNGKEIDRIIGAYPREYIENKIKSHM
jgi:thioredoxin